MSFVSLSSAMPSPTVSPIAHPLDEFYLQAGLDLPLIEQQNGDELPEPYRHLLVHERDMTSTLENFHNDTIALKVLSRNQRGDHYYREVILRRSRDQQPVEFGAIKINLNLFSPPVRRQILDEKAPLGRILNENGIPYSSRPKAYLRFKADSFMQTALQTAKLDWLYGRRNTLLDPQLRPLAEIVEILPPVASKEQ
jgi:chorismate-pyruvate lyase